MADPFGSNITAAQADNADGADPNFQELKVGQRLRQLRIDLDAVNADAASTAAVLAALAAAGGTVAINGQTVSNCAGIVGKSDANLTINSASQAVEIQRGGTARIKVNGTGIGFFNTTPVAQQAHIADATDAADAITRINAILAALENLGLLADS